MAKKIGDLIGGIEFSDSEKNRIGDSLRSNQGIPYEVFVGHAVQIKDVDFWRRAQKKFKVTGFRDGHPQAKQMVVRRALESLKNTDGSKNVEIWPLYRYTIYSYIKDEMPELNRLLRQEELEESDGKVTEQLLSAIKAKMPLYEFKNEEIIKLYDIWGFERIESLESILNRESLDLEVVKRLLASEVANLKSPLQAKLDALEAILNQKIDLSNFQTEVTAKKTTQIEEKLESTIAILRTEFQNLAASHLNTRVSELQSAIKKSFEQTVASPQVVFDPEALVVLEARVDKVSKRLNQLEEKRDCNIALAASRVIAGDSTSCATTGKVVEGWRNLCRKSGINEKSIEAIPVFLQVLMRTKVIITSQPHLLIDLFQSSGAIVRSATASPLWISADILNDERAFLESALIQPRVLIISDFDVALQEVYLIPFLTDWMQSSQTTLSKVILVPANEDLSGVNPRLLEMCWHFNWNDWIENDLSGIEKIAEKFYKLQIMNSSSSSIFKYQHSLNVEFEADLAKICANEGVTLPPRLMNHFMNVLCGLLEIMSHDESGKTAVRVCIRPWLRVARGESISRLVEERFRVVFGGT
ncbi:hypothetical protein [Bdellovibrio sp.]|uniref:hypothetical protein n=1 Tax=Bdellovibrio sp. TaxID=28201 RepID=UPI0039E6767E